MKVKYFKDKSLDELIQWEVMKNPEAASIYSVLQSNKK